MKKAIMFHYIGDTWDQGYDFHPAEPHLFFAQPTTADWTSMQSHRRQHTYQGLERSIQEHPVRQNSTVYQQIWTSTCQEVQRHFNEGPGVIFFGFVHLRHTETKRQTFKLVFQQPAIGEFIDEEDIELWKFYNILRYLHCCPVVNHDPTAEDYDPSYKIAEVRDYLETRVIQLFDLGQYPKWDVRGGCFNLGLVFLNIYFQSVAGNVFHLLMLLRRPHPSIVEAVLLLSKSHFHVIFMHMAITQQQQKQLSNNKINKTNC
jgi:hypothetical protein